jgi:hypothetical protein
MPFSYLNFINSSTPIAIDSSNGTLSFTPSNIETSVYSIRVDEYRNGVKIGSIKRQEEILIYPYVSGIPDKDLFGRVIIYPNPSQGSFRFEYRGVESGSATVQVINSMGQKIHEQMLEVVDGLLDTDINLNCQITSGIYIVRMLLNGSMHYSRMVVE